VSLLLLGCAVVAGALWNFQALGRGYAVLGIVSDLSGDAFESLGLAQSALAEQNFVESEGHFDNAQDSLQDARAQLEEAIAATEAVQSVLDVTGAVRSGDRLLSVGQSVTSAGQHLGRGLKHIAAANLVGSEDTGNPPLIGVMRDALAEFTQARDQLRDAEETLDSIPSFLLPGEVRQQVETLDAVIPAAAEQLSAFIDQGDMFLSVLGENQKREYLLVFQNNHELRATGGFIGSIGLVHVDQGVIEDVDVQSVYDPDGQLKEYIAPPDPLSPITDRWYLRDANWFIDYSVSARKIADFFEQEGGGTVDGVISLTPEVMEGMLAITGPIEMPTYGVTVDAENFTAVTQQQVTYFYDRELNRPKQFLADLTPILLNRVLVGDGRDPLAVLGVFTDLLQQKDMLVWLRAEDEAARIHELGWDGALPQSHPGFLSVVNTNIGGHKSDQFIEQEIDYRTSVGGDGVVESTVTIRRNHTGPSTALDLEYPPGENPAHKDNIIYQRVLVPVGATLLEAGGFTPAAQVPRHKFEDLPVELRADPDVAEWQRSQQPDSSGTVIGREAGYQTLANWTITKPGETTILFYRYRWPEKVSVPNLADPAKTYSVYVSKQPGDSRSSLRVEMSLPDGSNISHTVPHDGITQTASNQVTYRGALTRDVVVGGVWTKN